MKIPDEAVEATAMVLCEQLWDNAHERQRAYARDEAREALEAAAPHIAAQALREASDAYPLETAYGGAEHAVLWLKQRANHLEAPGKRWGFRH